MSLAEACWWTLIRTIILVLVGWPIVTSLERRMRNLAETRRPLALAVVLAPFLFPELLVGYAYRSTALAYPKLAELLCAGLLFIRIIPVGVVTLLTSPTSSTSHAAIYCRWMLLRTNPWSGRDWQQLALSYWYGPVRRTLPALGLMSIVAFQEFELAALLQTLSWTDWFITAQRLGMSQADLVREAFWPVVLQLPVLVGIALWISSANVARPERSDAQQAPQSTATQLLLTIYLILGLIFGCLLPVMILGGQLPEGMKSLVRQATHWQGLAKEITIAGSISICAGMTAWLVCRVWLKSARWKTASRASSLLLLIPGLAGSLLLSLATVELFQQKPIRQLYDTPLPWLISLIVWLMPRAALLHLWLKHTVKTEAVHLAEMLTTRAPLNAGTPQLSKQAVADATTHAASTDRRAMSLLFRLRDQPRLLAMCLMCYWTYLDLPTAYLLAPTGMPSGLVRLYNFMHFGRAAEMSAQSLCFFGTPLVVAIILRQCVRAWAVRQR